MTFAKVKSKNTYTESDVLIEYLQEGRFKSYNIIDTSKVPPEGWSAVRVHYNIDKSHDFWTKSSGEYNPIKAGFIFGKDLSKGSVRGYIQEYEGNTPLNQGLVLPYINFDTPLYFSEKEISSLNVAAVRPPYASLTANYNFFHAEHQHSVANHPETIAPNLYVVLEAAKKSSENNLDELNDSMAQHATMAGSVEVGALESVNNSSVQGMSANENIYYDPLDQISGGNTIFLDDVSQAIQNQSVNNQEAYLNLVESGFNIVFAYADSKDMDQYSKRKNVFPMDISVKFSRSESTKFANMFKEVGLQETFIKDFIAETIQSSEQIYVTEETTTISQKEIGGAFETVVDTSPEKEITIVDMDAMVSGIFESAEDQSEIDKAIFVLGNDSPVIFSCENNLYKTLLKLAFDSKYNSAIKENSPTFKDVLENKKTYSETLMYKVSKFSTDDAGDIIGNPIQNFYFFNNDEDDIIEFVDTQVKYGKKYGYRIYAHDMNIGLEYYYDSFDDGPTGLDAQVEFLKSQDWIAKIFLDVIYKPKVSLIETLVYESTARIMSRPPLPPEATMVPYRAVADKRLILMNHTTGKRKMQPVQIEDSDIQQIEFLRDSQDLEPGDPIEYAGDDIPSSYDIFRIQSHPESYADFKNNKIATVLGNQAASYLQTGLRTNTKYYYTFRVTDIHNMVSNPSPVFELEIVENSGVTYPIIKVVEFKKFENKVLSKSMKKYIYIKPADAQGFVNLEQSGLVNADSALNKSIVLGVEDESVWNKRFKFRFTSKDTGKKIDVNVRFVQKNLQT